jgi:regulator of sigma E protease
MRRPPTGLLLVLAALVAVAVFGSLQALATIGLFILILGGLVLVHEIGHFVVARLARVRVLEFGIGFPPRAAVLGRGKPPRYDANRPPAPPPALPPGVVPGSDEADEWYAMAAEQEEQRRGTLYTLNWLPIGGFVKLEGEDGDDGSDPHSFANARLPIKLLILIAGVAMNLLVAFVIFAALAFRGDPAIGVRFGEVVPESPAAAAGLQADETLVSFNGRYYSAFGGRTILDDLQASAGQSVVLGVERLDGTVEEITVQLRVPDPARNQGALGITDLRAVTTDEIIEYAPAEAIGVGAGRTAEAFGLILGGLASLAQSIVTDPTTAPPAAGPIGIADQIGQVTWTLGPIFTLYLVAVLSANLALVNALPIPPLDGGRIFVVTLRAFVGERLSVRAERLTYFVGFVLLFTFLIWITVFDIARLGGAVE